MTERRRPTAEQLYAGFDPPLETEGYPLITDSTHRLWELQQHGWLGVTPEEARALVASTENGSN